MRSHCLLVFLLLVVAIPVHAQLSRSRSVVMMPEPRNITFGIPIKGYSSSFGTSAIDTSLWTRIQSAMQKTYDRTTPAEQHGVGVSVIVPGLGQWSGAVGTTDDESARLTSDYQFEIGSCTKTFMSALILQLEDSGKLAIGDPIYKYLPKQYPNVDPNITIKQLLEHSSGIYDYINDDSTFALLNNAYFVSDTTHWRPEDILEGYVGPSHFKAGTGYQYSNTNYLLLGLISKAVTGNDPAIEIHRRFLEPLGLTHTFCCWYDSIPSYFCHNWTTGDSLTESLDYYSTNKTAQLTMAYTAGGIVSIPSELARWAAVLYAGKLLSPVAMKELLTFHSWPDGLIYGLGVMKVFYTGNRIFYGHTGGLPGFETMMFTNPKDTVTVVLYMNSDMLQNDVQGNDYLLAILDQVYAKPASVSQSWFVSSGACFAPNPIHDVASLELPSEASAFHVFDVSGREVLRENLAGVHEIELQRANWRSGAYFYLIELKGGSTVRGDFIVD